MIFIGRGPIVTGTSVLAIKYKDGVMFAADCLASYGSLARFRDVQRLSAIGKTTVLGTSGDISDFQRILQMINEIQTEEFCYNDGLELGPSNFHHILSGIMYDRRTKMKPLWNAHVVGGLDGDGSVFLGYVDLKGVAYKAATVATGYGAYIAQPLLRKATEGREHLISEQEACSILENCMRVLYYRDARSLNKIQIATVSKAAGVSITAPYELSTNWEFARDIRGYA